jgi:hypothetical protein
MTPSLPFVSFSPLRASACGDSRCGIESPPINAVRSLRGIADQPKGGHCPRSFASARSARLVMLSVLSTLRLPARGTARLSERVRRHPRCLLPLREARRAGIETDTKRAEVCASTPRVMNVPNNKTL